MVKMHALHYESIFILSLERSSSIITAIYTREILFQESLCEWVFSTKWHSWKNWSSVYGFLLTINFFSGLLNSIIPLFPVVKHNSNTCLSVVIINCQNKTQITPESLGLESYVAECKDNFCMVIFLKIVLNM